MERAGVFIGVDQTGNLRRLNDASSGARRVYQWALAQGMPDRTHAKLVIDEGGTKVTPDRIYDAIKEIIDGPGVDQLIIYFAGHGVNINRNEHWLLTDAPVKTSAAVNVSGSVELARYCGIRHIVFISDACRIAAEGIQAQNVRGVDIFPNDGTSDRARPVDQFFACLLGKTAAEIKDPAVAAGNFCALYTDALLDALKGRRTDVLERADDPADTAHYVKPVRLQEYLERELPVRVAGMGLQHKVNQNPDAILTAHPNWVSRLVTLPLPAPGFRGGTPAEAPQNLRSVTAKLVRSVVGYDPQRLEDALAGVKSPAFSGANEIASTTEQIAAPFGPDHFETECGFKIRGARLTYFFAPSVRAELLGSGGDLLRISSNRPAASVLLRFEGNVGSVIPAIAGFVGAITVESGEIADVSYEPSANTPRWQEYAFRAPEVRTLRAVAAAATQHGRFRLTATDSASIARRMQYSKGVDPTLAVYAAYAYHDLQLIERIREMASYMRQDLGVVLFDLALLGKGLIGGTAGRQSSIVPFVPLFSQGWALLNANKIQLHPALNGIERTMRESVWSLFDAEGLDMLRRALESGEVI